MPGGYRTAFDVKFILLTPINTAGGLSVEIARMNRSAATAQENLHKHLREVMERHKLPSPPIVVSKVLKMLNDPDFSVRLLSRVISDDAALASRTLAISPRSARYAQQRSPRRCMKPYSWLVIRPCAMSCFRRRREFPHQEQQSRPKALVAFSRSSAGSTDCRESHRL